MKSSDVILQELRHRINDEIDFRLRTPDAGRPVAFDVYPEGKDGRPEGEVGYVEFERIGMNLIERGKQTFMVVDDPCIIRLGSVADYTEEPVPGREDYCRFLELQEDGTWVNRYRHPRRALRSPAPTAKDS